MKCFEYTISVKAETQEEAIAQLTGENGIILLKPSIKTVRFVGYLHPDRKVKPYDVPPEGFTVFDVSAHYFATPPNAVLYTENDWDLSIPTPPGTLW